MPTLISQTTVKRSVVLSRRQVLRWAAAAAPLIGVNGCGQLVPESQRQRDDVSAWPEYSLTRAIGNGYGKDPDLIDPEVPWERVLSHTERSTARFLADVILPAHNAAPAASDLGVCEFLDEWVSAPYPQQSQDRRLLISGFRWVEEEVRRKFGVALTQLNRSQQTEFFDALNEMTIAVNNADIDSTMPARFFARLKALVVGAYYSTQQGAELLGFLGEAPILGDYQGPDEAALEHLAGALTRLNLVLPDVIKLRFGGGG